jgi:hypothetical protein
VFYIIVVIFKKYEHLLVLTIINSSSHMRNNVKSVVMDCDTLGTFCYIVSSIAMSTDTKYYRLRFFFLGAKLFLNLFQVRMFCV